MARTFAICFFCLLCFSAYFAKGQNSKGIQSIDVNVNKLKTKKRLALVIGNSHYFGQATLKNPGHDADSIANVLRSFGFDVMIKKDLNRQDFKIALDDFGNKLKDYEVGLFYYSGHGAEAKGENYLFPTDADPKGEAETEYACIRVNLILAKMEDAQSSTNILILDACRSNPFKQGWTRGGGGGLASMDAPKGTFIGFAASPGQTASDGTGVNGIYTQAILKNIRQKGVSITDVFTDVNKDVRSFTGQDQVPFQTSSLDDRFYFMNSSMEPIDPTLSNIGEIEENLTQLQLNEIGNDYYYGNNGKKKDYSKALHYYQLSADKGCSEAQYNLAVMYDAVYRDFEKAAKYYQLSADQGNSSAQFNLGALYELGIGVTKNLSMALKYYQMSADQGNSDGQNNLGLMYEYGTGVIKDYDKAVRYYQISADKGNTNGQYHLGIMYENGYGVLRDYLMAVKYYQMSANKGNSNAQYRLGIIYENGYGVNRDIVTAKMYYQLSADKGNNYAKTALKRLE